LKVFEAHLAASSGNLTCSQIMLLLMVQPTAPVDRAVQSHAHMHVNEGFKLKTDGFGGDAFSMERKKQHWENPTHLLPSSPETDKGRIAYGPTQSGKSFGYGGVMQDATRLPPTREFHDRTGLPKLPQVRDADTYTVFRKRPGQAPAQETYASMADVAGFTEANYIFKTGSIQVKVNKGGIRFPEVAPSPVHTMFPDSESQVMHLAASLLSPCGIYVLDKLKDLTAGSDQTMAIFSKSAVFSVIAADTKVPSVMVERSLEVDQSQVRRADGRYPTTGNVNTSNTAIDHVVTILAHGLNGDLVVRTCYPCKQTTGDTIGYASDPDEDVAETLFGVTREKKPVVKTIKLDW
jgi:hypothetical protein